MYVHLLSALRGTSGALALVLCCGAAAQEAQAIVAPAEQAYAPAEQGLPSFLSELFAPAAPAPAAPEPLMEASPLIRPGGRAGAGPSPALSGLIARHALDHGVPTELAHRVILKESRYNPAARNKVYWGLMQIRHDTARSVGYAGAPAGLLDADTNLRFGMAYLGNAYRAAGGDQRRAMSLYSRGYYYEAKRRGVLGQMRQGSPLRAVAPGAVEQVSR